MANESKPGKCHAQLTQITGKKTVDLAEVRTRLAEAKGPRYWRSLEELAQTDEFVDMLHREFPRHASEWSGSTSRREFLTLMAASMGLAGMTACTRQPTEYIVPYVRQPEEIVNGVPLFFATAMSLGGVGRPLLVRSNMGRPTKVEGNPDHPASLGGTSPYTQASILTLYDPSRSQSVTYDGDFRTWTEFVRMLRNEVAGQRAVGGAGVRFLTETISSPTLDAQLRALLQTFPRARWHQWEPVNRSNVWAGSQIAFGTNLQTHYRLQNADVIVSLDCDFLSAAGHPGFERYARDFAARRKLESGAAMSRLYVLETSFSNTGVKADHRIPVRASEFESAVHALAAAIGAGTGAAAPQLIAATPQLTEFINTVARELQQHRGRSAVIAGDHQTPAVHALAHAMNQALGNNGSTVFYTDPIDPNPVDQFQSLRELVNDINAGHVDLLVILGGNPVYNAPNDFNFGQALTKIRNTVHVGLYEDETSAMCHWHVPQAHYLEAWGDVRAYDGTISIVQPLIAPLYDGRSHLEVLNAFTDAFGQSSYDIVRAYWMSQYRGADFETFWRRSVHDGLIAGTALPPRTATPRAGGIPAPPPAVNGVEILFRPDPSTYDGRFAGNAWLQELPKPLFKVTWDNAALISIGMAERLGVHGEQVIEIEYEGRKVKAPLYLLPGLPDNSITLFLGYGRTRAGVGTNYGYDAYALRTSSSPWYGGAIKITPTDEQQGLSDTRDHWTVESREDSILMNKTLAEYQKNPDFVEHEHETPEVDDSLFPNQFPYNGYAWGMTIDLNSCVGCNACVIACQSENNIPVVGKREVARGREMHWLRIDRYFEGKNIEHPTAVYFQPVPCMQCENAPCELVCPVQATTHSSEGLNDMVYNRCVGTRYCSNNCPYKVRRFNFFLYSDYKTPSLMGLHNPDVTVRSRGVMEKCTYCVQRINRARVQAEKEDRGIRDGELETACQQACPADAIVFGDINTRNSRVAQLKRSKRNYGMLTELGTRPRTTYLAAVRNPNPALEPQEGNQ